MEHLTFKTAENIPGQAVPCSLAVTVEKAHWTFAGNLTAVRQYSADLFWAVHGVVREANPKWNPVEEGNG